MLVLRETHVASLPTFAHQCASHHRRASCARATSSVKPSLIRKQHYSPLEVPRCRLQSCRGRVHAGVVRAEISYIMVDTAPLGLLHDA